MASVNKSFVNTEGIELGAVGQPKTRTEVTGSYGYEEALDLTGTGRYNRGLLVACFVVITAMGIDIFGLGIIVTAASCDLGLTFREVGVLSSMPFAGIIVMSYPWGYLSDTRGRKCVLMWAMCGSFVSSALSSLSPNWQTLAALRFISSALSSAAESATYALLGECCGARVRARYLLLMTSALMLTPTLYYSNVLWTMRQSVPIALDVLMSLSKDEFPEVSEYCTNAVTTYMNKDIETHRTVEGLSENFYNALTSLPRILNNIDSARKLSALNLVHGYISIMCGSLRPQRLTTALSQHRYMQCCCNALLEAAALEPLTSLAQHATRVWAYLIMKLDFSYSLLVVTFRPWRLLALVMALPLGLGALMLQRFHESPKFLANVGRGEEAVTVLEKIFVGNGNKAEFPVKFIYLEEGSQEDAGSFSLRSLWTQIAPLFQPPLLWRTLLLYYLTFVIYIANNSFAIMLPTIFNVFFNSYATSSDGDGFCDLFADDPVSVNTTTADVSTQNAVECHIQDNTIWAGCAHGVSFFLLNAAISFVAGRRKTLTIVILLVAAAAAVTVGSSSNAISGLVFFYLFLTTAMVFGVVSSYFVDLYPTSYRGMVACLGMMVARLSAFAGTNIVSGEMTTHCSGAFYGAAALVFSGAVAASLLPADGTQFS